MSKSPIATEDDIAAMTPGPGQIEVGIIPAGCRFEDFEDVTFLVANCENKKFAVKRVKMFLDALRKTGDKHA